MTTVPLEGDELVVAAVVDLNFLSLRQGSGDLLHNLADAASCLAFLEEEEGEGDGELDVVLVRFSSNFDEIFSLKYVTWSVLGGLKQELCLPDWGTFISVQRRNVELCLEDLLRGGCGGEGEGEECLGGDRADVELEGIGVVDDVADGAVRLYDENTRGGFLGVVITG